PDDDRVRSSEDAARRVPESHREDIPPAWRGRPCGRRYDHMSTRANPAIIGAFVLGACIVLVAGLLLWGGTALFKPRLRYVMFFDTAVSGLQKGASVQLRGVRVGQVTDVQVRWGTSLIAVYVEFHPDVLKGVPQGGIESAIRRAIQDQGQRAQLRTQSFVTGVLYIAVDNFPG